MMIKHECFKTYFVFSSDNDGYYRQSSMGSSGEHFSSKKSSSKKRNDRVASDPSGMEHTIFY